MCLEWSTGHRIFKEKSRIMLWNGSRARSELVESLTTKILIEKDFIVCSRLHYDCLNETTNIISEQIHTCSRTLVGRPVSALSNDAAMNVRLAVRSHASVWFKESTP